MKYKRRRAKVSKYVSEFDNCQSKKRKPFVQRMLIKLVSIFMLMMCLSRLGVIDRINSKIVSGINETERTYSYSRTGETLSKKFVDYIREFCFVYLRGDDKEKAMAETTEYPRNISADDCTVSGIADTSSDLTDDVFAPVVPCPGYVSSSYGKRVHPVSGNVSMHKGTDIAAANGTEIRSCYNGVVTEAGYNNASGNHVKITHNNEYTSSYLHMDSIAVGVGDEVCTGDIIGYVGSTGIATGPHLHFEILKNGAPVDPAGLIDFGSN